VDYSVLWCSVLGPLLQSPEIMAPISGTPSTIGSETPRERAVAAKYPIFSEIIASYYLQQKDAHHCSLRRSTHGAQGTFMHKAHVH
jgi:hypothetical protein